MGENHILKDNRWFAYDVKWPKLENAKPTGLPIINGNGDELILLNGTNTQQHARTVVAFSNFYDQLCSCWCLALAFVY